MVTLAPQPYRSAAVAIGHYLILKNQSGVRVATFSLGGRGASGGGLQSFAYRKRLKTPGGITVRIFGNDDRILPYLALDSSLDAQWEFYRYDPLIHTNYVLDHEAFHRYEESEQLADGRLIYTSRGQGYNVFLDSETINYAKDSSQASKSGDTATVAYEFVDENIGPNAGVDANGDTRVRPGLQVAAVLASGVTWAGDRANKLLSDVLEELARITPADYMVLGTGPATFNFEWRNTRWGLDRTADNTDGNAPILFSARSGNVSNIKSTYSQLNAVTTAYILGQGRGATRKTRTVSDATLLALSPWARRAVARSSRNTYDDTELDDKGQGVIDKQRARRKMSFTVRQTAAVRYGRDWDIGDLVEVEDFFGLTSKLKIVGVTVAVASDGTETITPEFEAE